MTIKIEFSLKIKIMFTITINKKLDQKEIGILFQQYIIKKYRLEEINMTNHKWDCYGKQGIEIQIKLHRKDTNIRLGSYKNYSFMNYDFLLIIGEYREEFNIENINFGNVKIKTYYIECSKWNICFSDIDKNIEYMNDINENFNEEKEKIFYKNYGNYDDECFTKMVHYRKKRDKTKKNYKNGYENVWNLYIKKEKVEEFFKKFKEVNIIHYSYNNSNLKILQLKKVHQI